jgi:hypothetical protein
MFSIGRLPTAGFNRQVTRHVTLKRASDTAASVMGATVSLAGFAVYEREK